MGIGTAVYVSMRKYILRWWCRFVPKLQTFHSQLPTFFFFPPHFQFPIYFLFRTSHLPSPIPHFLFPLVTSSHSSLTAFATSELPLPISHLQFPTVHHCPLPSAQCGAAPPNARSMRWWSILLSWEFAAL